MSPGSLAVTDDAGFTWDRPAREGSGGLVVDWFERGVLVLVVALCGDQAFFVSAHAVGWAAQRDLRWPAPC